MRPQAKMETLWLALRLQVGMRIPTGTGHVLVVCLCSLLSCCSVKGRGVRDSRALLLLLSLLVRSLRSESVSMQPLVASDRCTTHIGVAAAFGCNGSSPFYPIPCSSQLKLAASCVGCSPLLWIAMPSRFNEFSSCFKHVPREFNGSD